MVPTGVAQVWERACKWIIVCTYTEKSLSDRQADGENQLS